MMWQDKKKFLKLSGTCIYIETPSSLLLVARCVR